MNSRASLMIKSPFCTIVRFKSTIVRPVSLNSKDGSSLPEFVYAGKNIKPHPRIYVMGTTVHGALGVKRFLRPPKGKALYKYMHRPHRVTIGNELKVEDIGCGYGFTVVATKEDGQLSFFGTGVATNCQIGSHIPPNRPPLEMLIEPSPIKIPLQSPAKKKMVACGRAHTMVWTDSDGLWTFGNNSYGQCGRPVIDQEDYASRAVFHRVTQFIDRPIEQLECGQDTSFVLSNGKVYSCGWSADGQTGRSTYQNVDSFGPVDGDLKGEKVVKISSKADCVLALTDKGDVFGWGNSEYRQLGSITEEQQMNSPRKMNLKLPDRVVDIAASGTCCFALTDAGDVWSWGYGILGTGPDTLNSLEPKLIPNTLMGRNVLTPDSKVTKVFAGTTVAAAVTNDGGLYAWGRNAGGCLGLGHTKFQHFPMRVCLASPVVKVSCGVDHMVILARSIL